MNIRKLLPILFLFFSLQSLNAGVMRRYDVDAGLSDNIAYDIVRDKDGVMWVGTNDGLSRIDSEGVIRYRSSLNGEKGLIIKSLSLHQDGKQIWIGGVDSLVLFDPYSEVFTSEPLDMIQDVCLNPSDGSLWVATSSGLYRKKEGLPSELLYPDKRFVCIYPSRSGQMMLGTEDGLFCWMESSSTLMKLAHTEDEVTAISAGNTDNTIVFGTFGGRLFEYNYTSRNCQEIILRDTQGMRLFPTRIHDIVYYQHGTGIIASDNGLIVSPDREGEWAFSGGELASESVYRVLMDEEGGLWYCSYFGGVYYSSRRNQRISYWVEDGGPGSMKGKSVSRIREGADGNLWVTTENGGLNCFDRSLGCFIDFSSKSHSNLHDALQEGNFLWTATFGKGIDRINLKTGSVYHYECSSGHEKYVEGNCAYCFLRTSKGELLAGTLSGIFRYDSIKDTFVQIPDIGDIFVSGLMEDYDGNVWAVSQQYGVYMRCAESGEWKKYDSGRGTDSFISAFLNISGVMWFGSMYSGLYRYDKQEDRLIRDSIINAYPISGPLDAIFQDGAGNFWFSSTWGILRINPKSGKIDYLTTEDGLPCRQFIRGAVCQTKDEALWFGSMNGLCSFNPDIFDYGEVPPVASIGRIDFIGRKGRKLGSIRPDSETVSVPRTTRRIVFHLNNSSFSAPGRNKYEWGVDGSRKQTDQCCVEVERLGRGKHIFELRCSNSDGQWSRKSSKTVLTVRPPLLLSYAAMTLYLAAIVLCLMLLARKATLKPAVESLDVVPLDRDKVFIARVDEAILSRLGDSDFSVQSLSEMMGMSRSNLQRKFSEIIGIPPRDYIRKFRLKKAAEYLRTDVIRVNEVAYKVGFTNLSYFSKSFREEFGESPKQYRERS